MKKVLFVCVGNSGRSQMAEAFFNRLAQGKAVAYSAGTMPAGRVDPAVIQVMQEEGMDISGNAPKPLTPELLEWADRVITMGCSLQEACPGKMVETEDWGLPDPKGQPVEQIRKIRDEIKSRVGMLLTEIQVNNSSSQGGKDVS